MMIRTMLAVTAVAIGVTAVAAQSDPIAARKALMKANGDHSKIVGAMAREKAPALFPDNSKTGGDTAALPKIWEDKADFNAKLAKFAADSKAAGESVKG